MIDGKEVKQESGQKNLKFKIAIVVGVLFVAYIGMAIFFRNHFYFGTTINGVKASGKTVEQVNDLLTSSTNSYTLNLEERNNKKEQIKAKDIDLKYDTEDVVKDAYESTKKEVEDLRYRLINLREIKIQNSSLTQKIKRMSQTVWSKASQAVIDEKMWIDIEVLMVEIYPDIVKALRDADLSFSEMHLCFLTLFKLDTKAMSTLLNIIPTSVDKTRLRVRKKLHWEGKQDFYESLIHIKPV